MTRQRAWQHAGREQVLSIGQEYDLPEAIAAALLATGAAERVGVVLEREAAVTVPDETGFRRRRKAS